MPRRAESRTFHTSRFPTCNQRVMARSSPSHHVLNPVLLLLLVIPFISRRCCLADDPAVSIPGCEPARCGNTLITYPFWLAPPTTTPSSFCGYRRMGLTCLGNTSQMALQTSIGSFSSSRFTVSNVNTTARTVTLVHADALQDLSCPRVLTNVTSDPSAAFSYSPSSDANITFFLNCTSELPGHVACLSHPDENRYSYVLPTEAINSTYAELQGSCERVVLVPVLRSGLDGAAPSGVILEVVRLAGLLQEGFQVEWKPPEMVYCRDCEGHGGMCGYTNKSGYGLEFSCHCPDGSTTPTFCGDRGKGLNSKLKLVIGFAGLTFGVILAFAVGAFLWRRRKRRLEKGNSSVTASFFKSITPSTSSFGFGGGDLESSPGPGYYQTPVFTYQELEQATGGFAHELGDGGFGTVYKGKLKDGRVVAIKCLHQNTHRRVQQFRNEIEILNRLRHQNLVTLYGCSTADSPKLLLVYEFIPNGTVADHLHGHLSSDRALTWSLRMSIAIESAAALSYLHAVKPQIIHRDVKTSNILLDSDFHVKVADFGLSRLFPDLRVTHVSTAPQGTPGYVDPEYHQCYQLTDKSDVYSFGVVLVELVSSMPAVDITRNRNQINLSNLALEKIPAGLVGEMADARLGYGSDPEVTAMVNAVCELAFRCLQQERDMRPTMQEVLDELRRIQVGSAGEEKKATGHDKEKSTSRDDIYLLNLDSQAGSSPPFSPNTVNGTTTSWPSRSTTPNASC